jgi:hypothetical protein
MENRRHPGLIERERTPPYEEIAQRGEPPPFAAAFDDVGQIPIPGLSPLTAHVFLPVSQLISVPFGSPPSVLRTI